MRHWLHKFILLFLILVIINACQKASDGSYLGKKAKDFKLMTLDHQRFYLNQNTGKVVILLFWATWCRICKEEMLDLNKLKDKYNSDDLVIAAVCTDPENIDKVRDIASSLNINYSVLLDNDANVTGKYRVSAFPTTVIIDHYQKIQFFKVGYTPLIRKQLIMKIQNLLSINKGIS